MIKHVFFIIFLLFTFLSVQVYATEDINLVKPYSISNVFSRNVQKVFGLNYIASKMISTKIENYLEHKYKGDFHIKITPYSALDLVAGKFKKLEITGYNIQAENIYLNYINAESITDFIHIDYKSKPVKLLNPLIMKFDTVLTEDDLNNTLLHTNYIEKIEFLQKYSNYIEIIEPQIKLIDDKMRFNSKIKFKHSIFDKSLNFQLTSRLKVKDNKIYFDNLQTNNKIVNSMLNVISAVLIDLNQIFKDNKKVEIDNLEIKDSKVHLQGIFYINKLK